MYDGIFDDDDVILVDDSPQRPNQQLGEDTAAVRAAPRAATAVQCSDSATMTAADVPDELRQFIDSASSFFDVPKTQLAVQQRRRESSLENALKEFLDELARPPAQAPVLAVQLESTAQHDSKPQPAPVVSARLEQLTASVERAAEACIAAARANHEALEEALQQRDEARTHEAKARAELAAYEVRDRAVASVVEAPSYDRSTTRPEGPQTNAYVMHLEKRLVAAERELDAARGGSAAADAICRQEGVSSFAVLYEELTAFRAWAEAATSAHDAPPPPRASRGSVSRPSGIVTTPAVSCTERLRLQLAEAQTSVKRHEAAQAGLQTQVAALEAKLRRVSACDATRNAAESDVLANVFGKRQRVADAVEALFGWSVAAQTRVNELSMARGGDTCTVSVDASKRTVRVLSSTFCQAGTFDASTFCAMQASAVLKPQPESGDPGHKRNRSESRAPQAASGVASPYARASAMTSSQASQVDDDVHDAAPEPEARAAGADQEGEHSVHGSLARSSPIAASAPRPGEATGAGDETEVSAAASVVRVASPSRVPSEPQTTEPVSSHEDDEPGRDGSTTEEREPSAPNFFSGSTFMDA